MRLAADANVLLSALTGGRASTILTHPDVEEIVTTETVLDEVREYAAELARKKGLSPDLVLLTASSLPVTMVRRPAYARRLREARNRLATRDPDDVDLLALALELRIPIWSNANDFEDVRLPWFTMAALLAKLGIRK